MGALSLALPQPYLTSREPPEDQQVDIDEEIETHISFPFPNYPVLTDGRAA